jgi:MSHA pilin protein MshC
MKTAARGFTMVELVVVIVLMGILGAVATARYVDTADSAVAAYAEQTRSMLRYAQKVAVAQHRQVFVTFTTNRIALCFASACAAPDRVLAPSGENSGSAATLSNCADPTWYCEGTPVNMGYALQGASPADFFFDSLGQPGPPSFGGMVVHITGSGPARDITVSEETGYVY